MKRVDFKKILIITYSVLILAVFILAGLNLFVPPHVRDIEIDGGVTQAKVVGNKIIINFSSPVNKEKIAEFISIEPGVKYSLNWIGTKLQVILKDNLSYSTEYLLRIKGGAEDAYGKKFDRDFEYRFKTKELKLTYIDKELSDTDKNTIIENNIEMNAPRELFQENNIKQFVRNENFLVVVYDRGDKTYNMKIKNLKTNEVQDFDFKDKKIAKIAMSPKRDEFIYSLQDISYIEGNYFLSGDYKLIRYDIRRKVESSLNLNNTAVDVMDFKYSPDANSLLYRGVDGTYYLLDLNNQTNILPLGTHAAIGDISNDKQEVIFINQDPIAYTNPNPFFEIKNAEGGDGVMINAQDWIIDPIYNSNDKNTIIYSEKIKDIERTRGIFAIVSYNQESGERKLLVASENVSLERPRLSKDGRFILIEKYSVDDLLNYKNQREYVFQTKPSRGRIIIYDILNNKVIDKGIVGVEGEWND